MFRSLCLRGASALLVSILMFAVSVAQDAVAPPAKKVGKQGWKLYRSPGGFSYEMPGQPEEQKDKSTGVEIIKYLLSLDDGNTAYIAAYNNEAGDSDDIDKRLDAIRDATVKKPDHKLIRERKIKIDGHPGRDLTLEAPDGLTIRRRYVVAKGKLFQLVAVTSEKATTGPADINYFLDSLKIVTAAPSIAPPSVAPPSVPPPAIGRPVGKASYDSFIAAIVKTDAAALRGMCHPSVQAKIDEPVLRLILLALKKELGAIEQARADDFKSSDDDGIARSEGTAIFERGKTKLNLAVQDGKIVSFNIDLKPLGAVDAKLYDLLRTGDMQKVAARFYEQRCVDLLKLVLQGDDQEAYDSFHPIFKKQFPYEKTQPEFAKSRAICGKLKDVSLEGFGVDGPEPDKLNRMFIVLELDAEKGPAKAKFYFQFVGMQSIITGFNVERGVELSEKEKAEQELKKRQDERIKKLKEQGVEPPPGAADAPAAGKLGKEVAKAEQTLADFVNELKGKTAKQVRAALGPPTKETDWDFDGKKLPLWKYKVGEKSELSLYFNSDGEVSTTSFFLLSK